MRFKFFYNILFILSKSSSDLKMMRKAFYTAAFILSALTLGGRAVDVQEL